MSFKVGPFTLHRGKDRALYVTLTALDGWPIGWEYGWDDPLAGRSPWLQVRLGKLMVFSFQAWRTKQKKLGFELWVMGFWWII